MSTEDALQLVSTAVKLDRAGDPAAPTAFQTALLAVEAELAEAPQNGRARLGRSLLLVELGREAEAIDELGVAIEAMPRNAAVFTMRGRLFERQGDLESALADYEQAVELAPEDPHAFRDLGDVKLGLGNRDGAMAAYDRALELDPSYVDVYRIRAAELLLSGGAGRAIRDYERVIELGHRTGPAFRDLGNAHAAADDLDGAIAAFSQAIEIQPNLTDAYLARAQAHGKRRNREEAIADYTQALEIDPSLKKAYRGRGRQRLAVDQLAGAVEDLTRAIELGDSGADTRYARGRAFAKLGNVAAAVEDFDAAIVVDPQLTGAYLARAEEHATLGEHDLALRDFEAVIALEPGSAKAYVGRGDALLALGDPEKALWDFDRALDIEPAWLDAHTSRIHARFTLGEQYANRRQFTHQRGAYIRALGEAEAALKLVPGEPLLHFYRAAGLRLLYAFDRAVDAALAGVETAGEGNAFVPALHREAADALRLWGEALHRRDRFEAALEQVEHAIAASSAGVEPVLYELRGHALLELGRTEESLQPFASAESAAPDAGWAYLGHGKALLQLGRPGEAIAILGALLDRGPDPSTLVWAHVGRSIGFAAGGDAERRAAEREAALDGAENGMALVMRATALEYFQDVDSAMTDLRSAIEREPDNAVALNAIAWLLADQPDSSPETLTEARELVERALELEGEGPDQSSYLDTAGLVAYRLEHYLEAVSLLRRAVALDPFHVILRSHLTDAERDLRVRGVTAGADS
jgi:tetratricopeptide (TPR) repeat protein